MKYLWLLLLLALPVSQAMADSHSSHTTTKTFTLEHSVSIKAAPEVVWSTVRDFDSPGFWDPSVVSAIITKGKNNQPGAIRHIKLSNGGTIDDQLTAWQADKRTFATQFKRSDLPVQNYHDRISVKTNGDNGSKLVWAAHFQAASGSTSNQAKKKVRLRITQALAHVKKMLGTGANNTGTPLPQGATEPAPGTEKP